VLDLDLTDLGIDGFAGNPVSAADADLPLPLLVPDDDEINGLGDGATPPLENGNLVDFYLPETPKRSGPRELAEEAKRVLTLPWAGRVFGATSCHATS